MLGGRLDEAQPLVLGPFAVDQLVDRRARGAPGARTAATRRWRARTAGRRRRSPRYWSSTSAAITDEVEQQVATGSGRGRSAIARLPVGRITWRCQASSAKRGEDRDQPRRRCLRPAPAVGCSVEQPGDRAQGDAGGRDRDQHDLEHRRQRLAPCRGRSGARRRPAAAANHTPHSVTRLATRSSAVSARLPSIAVEPVRQAAQPLSTAEEQRQSRSRRRRRCGSAGARASRSAAAHG